MTNILITTLINRWYVVCFLIAYVLIAKRVWGYQRTLIFLFIGYGIAFTSEWTSINYGFPYGWYQYIYANLEGEWLNHGVPVWDSASYVFMTFAGLCATRVAFGEKKIVAALDKLKFCALSATLTTLLDVIVDPVAHLGARWFLGKIYFYPNPGIYFDVTLANFAGWWLTTFTISGFAVFLLNFASDACLLAKNQWAASREDANRFLALGLYYGIFAFGVGIAIYLDEWSIVAADLFWIGLTVLIIKKKRPRLRPFFNSNNSK